MNTITRVQIINFRCFESLDLQFTHCHALIGENGTGKTAVLDAIDLVTSPRLSSSRLDEQDFNAKDAGPITIEVTFSEPFWLKIPDGYTTQAVPARSVVLTAKRRERAAPGRALTDPFVVEHFARPMTYADVAGLGTTPPDGLNVPSSVSQTTQGFEVARKSGKPMRVSQLQLSLMNELVGFPNVFCFDKDRERQARMGFNSLLQKIARDLNWRFRSKWNQGDLVAAWETFYNQVIATVEEPKTSRILRPLQEQASQLLAADLSDLELSLIDLEQPFAKTFLSRRNHSNQIDQGRLGSGISILVAYLLLDVISSLSKEVIVYLIDEPELHLHPQLQRRLFQRFRDSAHQTIYSTQSDCFVDVSSWRAITRFRTDLAVSPRPEVIGANLERSSIESHLDEIRKWHQHELIFFREDNQIFFARKCLLVEGPVEKYSVPVIAAKLGYALGDLTVISCNGKAKIPYYQLLCKAFDVPYYTLFDLDGRPETDGDNARPAAWADDVARTLLTSSFETLLGFPLNSAHKGSDILLKVDSMSAAEIPAEVRETIKAISLWSIEDNSPAPRSGS